MSGNRESVLALGAQSGDIQKLILVPGVCLALLGIVFGVAGSVGLAKSASSMLYGVTPADPSSCLALRCCCFFVALLACYVPDCKANRADPLVALCHE
jgi:putative ABC transport system permease protein